MNEKFIEHFIAIYRELALLHFASATFPDRCEAVRKLSVQTMAFLSLTYEFTSEEQTSLCDRLDELNAGFVAHALAQPSESAPAVH